MNKPDLSVILPFAGSCPLLEQAIISVLDDGFDELELILVNNGGDGNASAVAGKFRDMDSRIRVVSEPIPGISSALNTGLHHSRAEFIARMDADDISLPGRFSAQIRHLKNNPNTGLVAGRVKYSGIEETGMGFSYYVDQINKINTYDEIFRYRFLESPVAHPSVMFRKWLIDDHGNYSTDPTIPEDYELWLRWLEAGVKFEKIKDDVLVWNDLPERLSRTSDACSSSAFDAVRLQYLIKWLHSRSTDNRPILIWGAGKLGRRKARILKSAGFTITGFIDVNPALSSVILDDQKLPVLHYSNLPPGGEDFIVSFISNRGKAFEIEAYLDAKGYRNGLDFILCG